MRPEVEQAIGIAESAIKGFGGGACTREMLECIDEHVKPGMRTIETGCGRTTGAFLGAGALHTLCEVQAKKAAGLCSSLRKWDERLTVRFRGDSGEVLPTMWVNYHLAAFSFALMDGCDNDITTVTDAIYLWKMLKPGGLLLVDDVQQPWVKRAIGVLEEARAEDLGEVGGRSRLFRKAE